MIGMVIVTHGRLAEELRLALEHVVGPQAGVDTICIGPEDDAGSRCADLRQRIETVDTGDGVVLLTDIFGGTPSNVCISQMARPGVEVLAGVNLPMLVKLAKVRATMKLGDAVDMAQMAARKYIASASDVLPQCRAAAVAAPMPAPGPEPLPESRPEPRPDVRPELRLASDRTRGEIAKTRPVVRNGKGGLNGAALPTLGPNGASTPATDDVPGSGASDVPPARAVRN